MAVRFSIIVVSLNAGDKLNTTLDSVLAQNYDNYEVIVKDGGSTDGSIEGMRQNGHIRLYQEKDSGIYDAMNQAVSKVTGDLALFLNCGDVLYDAGVLEAAADALKAEMSENAGTGPAQIHRTVLYGDTYGMKNKVQIVAPPKIDGFVCYRNIPCHQSCFYGIELLREKPFALQYKIRADYDQFLWCYYKGGADFVYMKETVSSYEGGGFSESKANRKRDREEHKKITESYMDKGELGRYRLIMAATLAPLRSFLAESRVFSGIYHWMKDGIYKRKAWIFAAVLFFVVEMVLMLGPKGWAREEQVNYLTGEGMWLEQMTSDALGFCQEFTPQYRNIKSIGIVFSDQVGELGEGSVIVSISDKRNEVLFAKTIPYQDLELDRYTDIYINITLIPGKKYYLSVRGIEAANGALPAMGVCGFEYPMYENKILMHGDVTVEGQLLTRYCYANGIKSDKLLKTVFLGALAALGIAFGLPKSDKIRNFVGIALLLAGPYFLGSRLELLTIDTYFLLPFAVKWNVAILYLLELVILLITHSKKFTVVFFNLFITIVYSVNYFVYEYRGVPLRLSDLAVVKTVAKIVSNYNFTPDLHMGMAWCIACVFIVYGCAIGRVRKKSFYRKRVAGYVATFVLSGIILAVMGNRLLYSDMLVTAGFVNYHGLEQYLTYHMNGFLVGTCIDIKNSRVEPPEGYSISEAEEILRENMIHTEVRGDLPHVILIMNESWSDLRILGNLQLSEENMSFVNSLRENTVHGYVNASVLGGGTANSEFEVFTGCTMGFLSASYYAYNQCMKKPVGSLVSCMENVGYSTYSIHPQSAINWNRRQVYEYFGFDQSFWIEDFEGAKTIHNGVSDLETFYKVEDLYENRQSGEKLFIFDLTMQNHGGYENSDMEKTVQALNVKCDEADTYLTLVQETDRAFEQLVNYFANTDEKVIICMYGDHQPKFSDANFYDTIYAQTDGLSETDMILNQYKVPFVIWANYDIPEADGIDISMNYLGVLLLETAQIPPSPYFNFLAEYRDQYPVITVNGYLDSEGKFTSWKGDSSELCDYRILQYNYLFGNTIEWGFE